MTARPVRFVVKCFAVLSSAVGAASIAQIVRGTCNFGQQGSFRLPQRSGSQYGDLKPEAAVEYELNPSSVKGYPRLYRAETGLPPRTRRKKTGGVTQPIENPKDSSFKEYEFMSKEELIDALVMARINEVRLKKATQ